MKLRVLHYWHLVNLSPWPIILSFSVLGMPVGLVLFFQEYHYGLFYFFFSFFSVLSIMGFWFFDIVIEASYEGCHTRQVLNNLKTGMLLFIFSEVMFFFAFFWSFFWSAVTPTCFIGLAWPPIGLQKLIFNAWGIPFLNTIILLLSGLSITMAHLCIKENNKVYTFYYLLYTLFLAVIFLFFQYIEYTTANFDISDSVYGSTFFLCTGFHGFHVIIGAVFIGVTTFRAFLGHFSGLHHFGFEAAAWYWHFVDVVWLFLFFVVYFWGSNMVTFDIILPMRFLLYFSNYYGV